MSPSGLSATDTEGNEWKHWLLLLRRWQNRAAAYSIHICVYRHTDMYINLLRSGLRASGLNIHTSPLLYIGRPGVPFVPRYHCSGQHYYAARRYGRDKIHFAWTKESVNGSPRSIRSNRHNRDTRLKGMRYRVTPSETSVAFWCPAAKAIFLSCVSRCDREVRQNLGEANLIQITSNFLM